jgi:hypothetical protein
MKNFDYHISVTATQAKLIVVKSGSVMIIR